MGYETHNTMLNLGSIWFFGVISIFRLITYAIFKLIKAATGKRYKLNFLKGMHKKLFFSEFIVLVVEPYFEIIISGYLGLDAYFS